MPTAEEASLALTSKILTGVMYVRGNYQYRLAGCDAVYSGKKKNYVCFGRISYLIILQ
jgi:hypothetical protein